MSEETFRRVHELADKIGHCDPLWLKHKEAPQFNTFEVPGTGPEIILLHGLFGALSNWDSVAPCMAKYSKPIALQFPLLSGHRSEVKVKALAAYTGFYALEKKLDPVIICGNSLGGHVALRLCLAAPEMVDCLVLSGASGLYEHSVDALPIRPDKTFVRDHMKRVFFGREFITDEAVDEIDVILKDRRNVLNLIHAARSAKRDNLRPFLNQIKVPTLLLWGEDDEVTTMDVAEIFHKEIPNSQLITIKKCGHAPMIEHPEWFAEEVQKFLSVNSKRFKSETGNG